MLVGQKAQKIKWVRETLERINENVSHTLTNLFYFILFCLFSRVHVLTIYIALRSIETGRTRNNILKHQA